MADNLTLALKIKTDLQNTLTDLKALESGLERNKKAAESVGKSAQTGAAGVQKLGQEADRANNKLAKTSAQIGAVSQQLSRLKTLVLGFTLGTLALGNFTQAADEYKNYETRVRLVSKSNAEAKGTFSELMQIANDTGAAFSATAELYTRLYRAMGNNANSAELLQFTRTIQQITAISGAGAEEAKAAIVQLAQGLASGALRGDEFNSVAEQMPILLEILQKSLGKTRAELRKMAEDGEITPQLILGATKQAQEEIQKQYDQMPLTLGRAVTQLSNSWLEFVGNTDKTTSASSIMAGAISGLAGNLKLLANIAIVAGAAYSVHLIAPLVKKTVAWGANTLAINANTAAQARGAQASTVTTGAVNRETVSVARLTQAYGALAAVKAKAAATSIGSGLLAFAGGWTGVAITAAIGLYAAYDYLKSKEEELDAQYQQTTNSVQANIDKTNSLINHPVLEPTSEWSEDITAQYMRLIKRLDNETGLPYYLDTANKAFQLTNYRFVLSDRDMQRKLRNLFYYLRGRQRAIWVATSATDVTPVGDLLGKTLDIAFINYTAALQKQTGRQDVRIECTDGRIFYRRIVSAAVVDSNTERLALDGETLHIKQSEILKISFLTLSRLDSDTISWVHHTDADGVATVSVSFRGLRDELEI